MERTIGQPQNEVQLAKLIRTAHQLVDKATNPGLQSPDWEWNSKIIDFLRYFGGLEGARQVLKSLKRRWRSGTISIQTLTLDAIDYCVRGAGRAFAHRMAGAELWRDLKDAAKMKTVKNPVYDKLLLMIREWALYTKSPSFIEFYEKLQSRGYTFPPRSQYEAPPQYIPITKRKEMNEENREKLDQAEKDVEEQSVMGEDTEERDDDIPDTIVQTRVDSFDLINLLDLDFEDPPSSAPPPPLDDPFAPGTPAAPPAVAGAPTSCATPVDPFGPLDENLFSSIPAAPTAQSANPFGNPFGDTTPAAPPVVAPTQSAPATAPGNPFGNPFGGSGAAPAPAAAAAAAPVVPSPAVAANPFGDTAAFGAPQSAEAYNVGPTSTSFSVAQGPPQPTSFTVGQQGVWSPYPMQYGMPPNMGAMPQLSPMMGEVQQPGGWNAMAGQTMQPGQQPAPGGPMRPQTVADTLASIPPPAQKPKDPLADLLS